MSTPTQPASPPDAPARAPDRPARRRRLDARIVAISVCLALVVAAAAGLVTSLVLADDGTQPASGAGDLELTTAPEPARLLAARLVTVDGSATTLRDLLGDQPTVVNLWAQSCVPCVEEMPLLEQAHRDNPDLDFLGVDTQDRLDEAMVLADRTGITYPWVQDPDGSFFYEAKGAGMPTTLLVDPAGEVLASRTGAFTSQGQLQRWLDEHRD